MQSAAAHEEYYNSELSCSMIRDAINATPPVRPKVYQHSAKSKAKRTSGAMGKMSKIATGNDPQALLDYSLSVSSPNRRAIIDQSYSAVNEIRISNDFANSRGFSSQKKKQTGRKARQQQQACADHLLIQEESSQAATRMETTKDRGDIILFQDAVNNMSSVESPASLKKHMRAGVQSSL